MSTINDQAARRRKNIEEILVRKYEGRMISLSGDSSSDPSDWGTLTTVGVEWIGGDDYQVILNFNGSRIVMDYPDFLEKVEVIDGTY